MIQESLQQQQFEKQSSDFDFRMPSPSLTCSLQKSSCITTCQLVKTKARNVSNLTKD